MRALLHIDARPLTFVATDDGKKTASVDVLGMVFDQDGTEVAHLSTGFTMGLTRRRPTRRWGTDWPICFASRSPVPVRYQVRFAVRDQHSGAIGSAGEFVELHDVAGGAFALSGIVLRPDEASSAGAANVPDDIALNPAQALERLQAWHAARLCVRDLQCGGAGAVRYQRVARRAADLCHRACHARAASGRRATVRRGRRREAGRPAATRQLRPADYGDEA